MGSFALPPEEVTEDYPVVVGTVESVNPRQGLVLLYEHGAPCFLAGARLVGPNRTKPRRPRLKR
jgi:hypothetical protein